MKKKVILGLTILGVFSVASVVLLNERITLTRKQMQTNIVPIQYKGTNGTLAYDISFAKNEFGIDEEIIVGTKLTNMGSETIAYISSGPGPSCTTDIIIKVMNEKSKKEYFSFSPNERVICTMDVRSSKLDPGQTVESIWKFTPTMAVESGTYDVMVYLPQFNILKATDADVPGYPRFSELLAKKIPITIK